MSTFHCESKYLKFRYTHPATRKTPIVYVTSKSTGAPLGEIRWFTRWRQFCFFPERQCVFNKGCLNDINKAITELMTMRNRP